MGGRSSSGIRNSKTENIKSFLDRAVGDNDAVRIEANDMTSVVGRKEEVLENARFKKLFSDMYFAGFKISNGEIVIQAVTNSETAKERLKRR